MIIIRYRFFGQSERKNEAVSNPPESESSSSRSLWGFSGHPSGVPTRPSAWCLKQRNIRRTGLGQEYQGLLPGLTHRAWIPHVGTPLQSGFSRRCDAQGRDSSPHAGDCKRTSASPSKLPIPDADRGPKGKGRLVRVCGLRRLTSSTIEKVRRVPWRGSGVATKRARRVTLSSFLLPLRRKA